MATGWRKSWCCRNPEVLGVKGEISILEREEQKFLVKRVWVRKQLLLWVAQESWNRRGSVISS